MFICTEPNKTPKYRVNFIEPILQIQKYLGSVITNKNAMVRMAAG